MLIKYFIAPTMRILLLLASLQIIATPGHAHARILKGLVNSASDELYMMIISVCGRPAPSPPPPPFSSPPDHQSTRGNTSPCDHDTTNTYNDNKIKCLRAYDYLIRSPSSPPVRAAEGLSRDEHYQVDAKSPPPTPKGSVTITPLRTRTSPAFCMPGRPCSAGGFIM